MLAFSGEIDGRVFWFWRLFVSGETTRRVRRISLPPPLFSSGSKKEKSDFLNDRRSNTCLYISVRRDELRLSRLLSLKRSPSTFFFEHFHSIMAAGTGRPRGRPRWVQYSTRLLLALTIIMSSLLSLLFVHRKQAAETKTPTKSTRGRKKKWVLSGCVSIVSNNICALG